MSRSNNSVIVSASGRLHLGLVKTSSKPEYLSAGLSLVEPVCKVRVTKCDDEPDTGHHTKRVTNALNAVCDALKIENRFSVKFIDRLAVHSGFGSGSRHDLCVAKGVAQLARKRVMAMQLAEILGRGTRSMMGIALFSKGGFAIEAGATISHSYIPPEWRVILINPKIEKSDKTYIHGQTEDSMISNSFALSLRSGSKISGSVRKEMLGSICENDFKRFELAVNYLQNQAVKQFGSFQGGSASTNSGRMILEFMKKRGLKAIGQSSWGPTVFALAPSEDAAESIIKELFGLAYVESAQITGIASKGYQISKCKDKGR